jgi:hypothetical protein
MNTEMARSLVAQRHDELTAHALGPRRVAGGEPGLAAVPRPRRRMPRWRLNWTRETLAPAGTAGRGGRSWVIIISATIRDA